MRQQLPASLARRFDELDRMSAISEVFDSRLMIWCERTGMHPDLARQALANGHSVRFCLPGDHPGQVYLAHSILPGQVT
jgi:hypothetical protein